MQTTTEMMELSLTKDTVNMLRAFTAARNGSMHNQADAAIRAGIYALLAQSNATFQQRYEEACVALTDPTQLPRPSAGHEGETND